MPRLTSLLCLLSLAFSVVATAAAPAPVIDMNGKTALVTGSTSGLGEVVARRLGRMGATVIVHGLDEGRGRVIAAEITAAGPGRATYQPGDLGSLEEVRELAARIRAAHPRLHLLVNNAGILGRTGDPRRESRDGHELTFAINYLSHFLLTRELLPQLQAGAPARIVNVASGAQRPVDFDDVMLKRDYQSGTAYAQSKLAQVTFTMSLAEQLDPAKVTVNALHPATMMNTPMVLGNGMQARSSVEDGANAVMQLAVGAALSGRTGLYFNQMNEARANAQAYDASARKRLWDLSVALTQARALAPSSVRCDRACLQKWVDNYLAAMRDQNRDPALFAADVRFTENGVRLPIGREGLWWGMSGIGTYKFYIPDTETQQIAFLGTVRENGKTQADGDLVAIALRLKIQGQRITEVEQIVSRPSNSNSSRGDFPPTGQGVEAMGAPHPIFTTAIPENERASRAELIETANYYFTGLENNDGKGYYPFTDDCVRFENAVDVLARGGTRTTCKKQFEEGLKGIVDRVRDRRFVAVDRERGIVFAFGFFDHHRINWTWQLAELFRIEKGQIRRIEAIFHRAPFGMPSGWSTYEQGMSSQIQDVR